MILIIDDDKLLQQSYERVLSKISPVIGWDGIGAKEMLGVTDDINLILMETEYAQVELDDLLDMIRVRFPYIPIIFVSNNEQSFKKDSFVNWGIYHFLVKPVDLVVLETTINHLLINQRDINVYE